MSRPIHIPFGGPPQVAPPSPEIYALMGEANIFRLIEDFYMELGQSEIAEMFGKDLVRASEKSAAFFVGLLGGPPLYHQRYGSPALRARHMPFVIDEAARVEWLRCFDKVLESAVANYNFPAHHLEGFRNFLHVFSGWMVNTE